MKKDLLCYINTYNRTETTLPLAVLSVLNQTYKPDALVIFDDNKEFKNPLENSVLKYLLDLSMEKGIQWFWEPGQKKGAHFNHESANKMGYKLNFFIDDDHVLEKNVIEKLVKEMTPDVGAVAGLILKTPTTPLPNWLKNNKMDDLYNGENIQWHTWAGKPRECEHLYSSFLYRPNIAHWDTRLSRKTFRGETMFTHSFFLKGYKLIVTPDAITYHFEGQGGCRSAEQEKSNQEMYAYDDQIFRDWLNFKRTGKKLYFLNEGLGDNYMFKQVIEPEKDTIIATCFPDIWQDYKVISIAEAEKLVDKKDYSVYEWATFMNWKGTLQEAYLTMYENINHKR